MKPNPTKQLIKNPSQIGLEQWHLDILYQVFESIPGLLEVWLFGSRARGDYKLKSDFDMVIITTDTLDTRHPTINELQYALDISDFWYSVDLKEYNKIANPVFLAEINRDRVLLWKRGAI